MSNINLYENKNQQIRSTSDLLGYIQEFVLPAIVASSPSGGITLAQMTALMESLLISPTNSSTVGFNSKVAIDLLLDIMKELSLVDGTQSVFYDPNTNDNNVLASLRNLLYSIDDKGTNSNTMLQLIQSYMNSGSGSVFKNESGQKLLDLMLSHLSDISQNSETIETYIGLIKDFQSTSLGDSVFKNSGGQKLLDLILGSLNNGAFSVFKDGVTGNNDVLNNIRGYIQDTFTQVVKGLQDSGNQAYLKRLATTNESVFFNSLTNNNDILSAIRQAILDSTSVESLIAKDATFKDVSTLSAFKVSNGESVFKNTAGAKLLQLILDAQNTIINTKASDATIKDNNSQSVFKDVSNKSYLNRNADGGESVFYNPNTGINDILNEILTNTFQTTNATYGTKLATEYNKKTFLASTITVPINTPIGNVSGGGLDIDPRCRKLTIIVGSGLIGNLTLRSDGDVIPSKIMSVTNMANNASGSNMVASQASQAQFFNTRYAFNQASVNIVSAYDINVVQWLN